MLKAIVQQVHRRREARFGELPRFVTVGADDHRYTRQRASQHHRLIPGVRNIAQHAVSVRDDRGAGIMLRAPVSAAEHTRAMSTRDEHLRDALHGRRLAAAADPQVADADDGAGEPAPTIRIARVPPPPPGGGGAVHRAQRLHDQ